ncbi:MAG: PAS domain-containing protein [Candidatus Nitrohelix vancouverensis]|uniref:PAS domain-containing protein n=1 Tax=Candidatus Nitrohelix vancouverensis TaxID=2705534 RepID=A0A7T0C3A9_9BACT|nr:MAG: PAS domain-containing protein [Candidatus Nitrohelix vancouverensis]
MKIVESKDIEKPVIPTLSGALVLLGIIFGMDLSLELGIASGIPYTAIILIGVWLPGKRYIVLLAILASLLTIAGYYLSPATNESWKPLMNRGLILFSIWVVALLCLKIKAIENALFEFQNSLRKVINDRTEGLKKANDLLKKEIYLHQQSENENFKLIQAVEKNPNAILITDQYAQIEYANPQFYRRTGYTEDEIIGEKPRILQTEGTSKAEYKIMWDHTPSSKEWKGEIRGDKKNERSFWSTAQVFPINDEDGKLKNFIAIEENVSH